MAIVLLYGPIYLRLAGFSSKIDKLTQPFLLLLVSAGAASALRPGPRARPRARLRRALHSISFLSFALLLMILPLEYTAAKRNATPWKREILCAAAGACIALALERASRKYFLGRNGARPAAAKPERIKMRGNSTACSRGNLLGGWGPALLTAWALWALVCAFRSPFFAYAIEGWRDGPLMLIGFFWVSWMMLGKRETLGKSLSRLVIAALAVLCFSSLLQWGLGYGRFDLVSGKPLGWAERFSCIRAVGLTRHPNYLALLASMLLLFAAGQAIPGRKRASGSGLAVSWGERVSPPARASAASFFLRRDVLSERMASLILCALTLCVLALTHSRGGALGFLAGAAVLALLLPRSRKALLRPAAILAMSLCAAGFIWLNYPRLTAWTASRHGAAQAFLEATGGRPVIWRRALKAIAVRPLRGWGPSQNIFPHAVRMIAPDEAAPGARSGAIPAEMEYEVEHAHQTYLEIAFETGWPGLLLFLAAIGCLITGACRKTWPWESGEPGDEMEAFSSAARWIPGALAAAACMLLHGLIDLTLARGIWFLLGLLLAILARANDPARAKPSTNPGECASQ